jgi:hypothetical protein
MKKIPCMGILYMYGEMKGGKNKAAGEEVSWGQ